MSQMYSDHETAYSRRYLSTLLRAVSQPPCLMGGWAVQLQLNDQFNSSKGREYLGSRDIDLGFHLDPNWTAKEFQTSDFYRTIKAIKKLGFEEQSFRFVKHYHWDSNQELSIEEARELDSYQMFDLFVDLAVDTADPRRIDLVGSSVIDEPLLKTVFLGKERISAKFYGTDIIMPTPRLLIEMKLKSFPDRTQDDKKTKDLADICALMLYTQPEPLTLTANQDTRLLKENFERGMETLAEEEWDRVGMMLDESRADLIRLLRLNIV
ncbi:MAG: hypothetical protein OK439_00120 [Thaumarchaeota archaeon]|nr:hypothetical protein [Nitrososphaerota archaeon]